MSLIDLFIILVAALILFLGGTPLGWTVIITLIVLIVERLLVGERPPALPRAP